MIALWVMDALAQEPASVRADSDPRFGVMLELGSLRNADPAYDLFADRNGIFSFGGRLTARPAPRLEVRAGYHFARHGGTVLMEGGTDNDGYDSYDSYDYGRSASLRTAFYGHEATLGLRVDAAVQDVLFPYLAADGMLLAAAVRLDDDPELRDNVGQVSAQGYAPGAGLVGGFEVRGPPGSAVQVSCNLEIGYTMLARLDLGELGQMQAGGLTVRSGLGVRF